MASVSRVSEPSNEQLRRDTQAALRAGQDLGADYHDAVAESLYERIQQLQRHDDLAGGVLEVRRSHADQLAAKRQNQRFVLGIISLAAGIPITAIAALNVTPGLLGVVIVWLGIVGVNVVFGQHRGD